MMVLTPDGWCENQMRPSSSQSLWTTDITDPFLPVKQILYIHSLLSIPTLQLREESLRDLVTSQITWTCVSCTWQNTWRLVAYADRDLTFLAEEFCLWVASRVSPAAWQPQHWLLLLVSRGSNAAVVPSNLSVPQSGREWGGTVTLCLFFILQTKALWETSSRLQPTFPC